MGPNLLTALTILLFSSFSCLARPHDDEFIKENLQKNVYAIDSNANAIVLYERYNITVDEGTHGYEQVMQVHRTIKILKEEGIHLANVTTQDVWNNTGSINKVRGVTYNLENGEMQEETMQKDAIYTVNENPQFYAQRFTLPDVKVGSIIDYSYETVMPLLYSLPSWNVMGPIPKLRSEYELDCPTRIGYMLLLQGDFSFKDFSKDKDAETSGAEMYHVSNKGIGNVNTEMWGVCNVDAANDEPFISCLENHVKRVDFQLSGFVGFDGGKDDILTTWDKLNEKLWTDDNLGHLLEKSNNFLNYTVDSLIAGKGTDLDKAKAIFKYVRSNYHCIDRGGIDANAKLDAVYKNQQGNEAALNLLLIAMLRKAGINASPVVLSRLGGLQSHAIYPLLNRLNTLVAMVQVGDDRYYLDATDKYNRFGILPAYCYNGYVRIIDKNGGEGVNLTSDDMSNEDICAARMYDVTDSGYTIDIVRKLGTITSWLFRKQMDKDSSGFKKYFDEQAASFTGNASIVKSNVEYLNDPDTNLIIKFTVRISNNKHNKMYYMPTDIMRTYKKNPFTAVKRHFPIEFPFKNEEKYVLSMQVPANFQLQDSLKPTIIKYEDGQLEFKHLLSFDSSLHILSVTSDFSNNATEFPVIGYNTMKDFFEKMVTEENTMIAFKKTNQ